jgi:hypothetical protein
MSNFNTKLVQSKSFLHDVLDNYHEYCPESVGRNVEGEGTHRLLSSSSSSFNFEIIKTVLQQTKLQMWGNIEFWPYFSYGINPKAYTRHLTN